MESNLKAGDKLRLISKEKSDIESTNWIVNSDENSVEIGDIFTFTQYGSNNEWINLEELVYAHPIDKFKKVIDIHESYMLGSEYDNIEEFKSALDKVIVINPTDRAKYAEEFDRLTEPNKCTCGIIGDIDTEYLQTIHDKDIEFYNQIQEVLKYLASTYSEKYEIADSNIKSKDILLSIEGKSANMFTASKYLQRYNTKGTDKSENIKDLFKSVHYILFELQRREKYSFEYNN